ncbi:MAG: glycosyltransferase [Bacteroides sp.]|nr:glycosyltransferase [Bacteroides sp.]
MKISVITVCYNAVDTLEQTIKSVLGQTYPNIEYIIIDGGSTGGSIDIIHKYAERIAYWVSEPDEGIYDAMNKGIKSATGEWVNFMNAGDTFANPKVLETLFCDPKNFNADVLFGNSYSLDEKGKKKKYECRKDITLLKYMPIYRHGASFVRTTIHKKYLFDLSRRDLGYALDGYCIHSLYVGGCQFKRVDYYIITYLEEGISNHPYQNARYNYLIATNEGFSLKALLFFIYACIIISLRKIFRR